MAEPADLGSAMKSGMRHLASGVAVVATRDDESRPHAMTVTSITSLTDQPASLLVCLHREATTFKALDDSNRFSANILRHDQDEVSNLCAFTPEDGDRFSLGQWRTDAAGEPPYLVDALASFICRVSRRFDYGTHCIVVGDIESVRADDSDASPLVFCRSTYHALVDD